LASIEYMYHISNSSSKVIKFPSHRKSLEFMMKNWLELVYDTILSIILIWLDIYKVYILILLQIYENDF
jgi:hypothetical protein